MLEKGRDAGGEGVGYGGGDDGSAEATFLSVPHPIQVLDS